MSSQAIKVSESTYSFLKKKAQQSGKSIKEIVDGLAEGNDFSNYAGSWEMSDEETEEIRKSREKMWEEWKP
jgi:hypothetical protein